MYKDILLGLMMLAYIVPILYIYVTYSQDKSVSGVIGNEKCNIIILISMLVMGYFTILYEIERDVNNSISFICMALLLIGIYGVICIDEYNDMHYVFAFLVFVSILGFMAYHSYLNTCSNLNLLLCIQIILLVSTIVNMHDDFFYIEALFILNFAVFYLYLHYKMRGKNLIGKSNEGI